MKAVEKALRESESRYRTMVESSPFRMCEVDLKGRFQSMNKAGLDMLGVVDEDKIRGVFYRSIVSEKDRSRIDAFLQDAINGKTGDFEYATAGDVPTYFRACLIPIRDVDGKVVKLMGLAEDITERKKSETEMRIAAAAFEFRGA